MMTTLRKCFDTLCWQRPFHALPTIEEDGLTLGRGTVLARMAMTRSGEICLAVEADQERTLALLSATYGWQVDQSFMKQIDRASAKWQRGDKAGAHIELAFARFPRLRSDEDAFHLFVAADLLAQGMTPRRLVRELGFDETLLKYDPNQPRVPAGSGRESGRWGSTASNVMGAPRPSPVTPDDNKERAPNETVASFTSQNDGTLSHSTNNNIQLADMAVALEKLGGGPPKTMLTPKGATQFIFPNGTILRFDLEPGQYLGDQGPHINLELPGGPNIHIPIGP